MRHISVEYCPHYYLAMFFYYHKFKQLELDAAAAAPTNAPTPPIAEPTIAPPTIVKRQDDEDDVPFPALILSIFFTDNFFI